MIGKVLSHYEIREPLGSGGMGDVYRAHDTTLGRDVAIKVLPEDLADDPDRLARLKREAHLLAALNHPNVATIFGFEESDGTRFLVMELVKGESLEQRLAGGALPVDEALGICRQIAEALEAAHDEGIIHRDLKPANVLVTPEGRAKVLDFGLAKTVERADHDTDMTQSPTITIAGTEAGVILGTAPYMSPEQVRGKPLDKRADIWAFGCVLYETLTGRRAFNRETIADTLAAILEVEPDWDLLPKATPVAVRALLQRCLQKDPRLRLRDIGDAWVEIEMTLTGPVPAVSGGTTVAVQAPLWRRALPWAVAGVAIAALAVSLGPWSPPRPDAPAPEIRPYVFDVEDGYRLSGGHPYELQDFSFLRPSRTAIALSPDGKYLVYSATDGERSQLFRRAMDQTQAIPIPGTEGASRPFFSPDSQSVGFLSIVEGEMGLKRVSIMGGDVRPITADSTATCGATWAEDDSIIFPHEHGLARTSSSGEGHDHLTLIDEDNQEWRHCSPQLLPGGMAILFTVEARPRTWGEAGIVVQLLETGVRTPLVKGATDPRYLPTGHLVYAREGVLMARTFDPASLSMGDEVPVVEGVMHAQWGPNQFLDSGAAQFSFSQTGDLVYVPGSVFPIEDTPIVWIDTEGESTPIDLPIASYYWPRISPDDRYLAYTRKVKGEYGIWISETRGGFPRLLTDEPHEAGAYGFAWSPDSEWIAYSAAPDGGLGNIFVIKADGTEAPQRLTRSDQGQWVAWWPTNDVLAYYAYSDDVGGDVWLLRMGGEGEREGQPFLNRRVEVMRLAFSHDGAWVAFDGSIEDGRRAVYIREFPDGVRDYTVDVDAQEPLWSPVSGELFYRKKYPGETPHEFMVVEVAADGAIAPIGKPQLMFEREWTATIPGQSYDVNSDGSQFVTILEARAPLEPATKINVVLNWFEELKRRVPTGR